MSPLRWTLLSAIWAASFAGSARAQTVASNADLLGARPDHIWTADYGELVWDDTLWVIGAPLRWNEGQWLQLGGAIAAVAVTVPFDETIHHHVQDHRTGGEDRFLSHWQNFGNSYSFIILGGFEAWGELGDNTAAKSVAMDGVAATIIASGLIAPTLKYIVGRERPSAEQGAFKFHPFTSNISFPSGHATQAFAVATVIAEHYRQWWVQALAYGCAELVGYARIEQNAHFASDVVAGAILGTSVARSIVHRNDRPAKSNPFTWSPYLQGNGGGVVLAKSY